MQEFKFHEQRVCGAFRALKQGPLPSMASAVVLEGFMLWTADGIYECRPKVCSPPSLFHFPLSL